MHPKYLLAGAIALFALALPAATSSCPAIATNMPNNTASDVCDSNCVHRILYRTAYSSAAIWVQQTMIAFDAFDWCTSDPNKDWCPEAIDTALSTITSNSIAGIEVDFEICAAECLFVSMWEISHQSALLAIEWSRPVFEVITIEYEDHKIGQLEDTATYFRNATTFEGDVCQRNDTLQSVSPMEKDSNDLKKYLALGLTFLAAPRILLGPFANSYACGSDPYLCAYGALSFLRHFFDPHLMTRPIYLPPLPPPFIVEEFGPWFDPWTGRILEPGYESDDIPESDSGSPMDEESQDSDTSQSEDENMTDQSDEDAPQPEDEDVNDESINDEPQMEDEDTSEADDDLQPEDEDVNDESIDEEPQMEDEDISEAEDDVEPDDSTPEDSESSGDSEMEQTKQVEDASPFEPRPEGPELPSIDDVAPPPPAERLFRAEKYNPFTNRLEQQTLREVKDLTELNHASKMGKRLPFDQLDEEGQFMRRVWREMKDLKPLDGTWKQVGNRMMRLDGALDTMGEPLIASEAGTLLTVEPVAGASGTISYRTYNARGQALNGGRPVEIGPPSPVRPVNPATPLPHPTQPDVAPPTDIPPEGSPLPTPWSPPVPPPPTPLPATPVPSPPPAVPSPTISHFPFPPFSHDSGEDGDEEDDDDDGKHEAGNEKSHGHSSKSSFSSSTSSVSPAIISMPPPTTLTIQVKPTKSQSGPVTVTVEDVEGLMTDDAAAQIGNLPKYCVVDDPHLRKLHHHQRHECENKISALQRSDAVTWVHAIMRPECLLDENGEAPVHASGDKNAMHKCERAIGFKHDGNRRTWTAGMMPKKCPYKRPHGLDDIPPTPLSHDEKKWCHDVQKRILHDNPQWHFWQVHE